MISLEQVKELNRRVLLALSEIRRLQEENGRLLAQKAEADARIKELEGQIGAFNRDNQALEAGILGILEELDKLEQDFHTRNLHVPPPPAPSPGPAPKPGPSPVVPGDAPQEEDKAKPEAGETLLEIF
ncbi:MAG: hypothetical protein LBQ61_07730 [Spirochaetales bacterium]|jgi:hypothetical protein|nr:hypothetical protein [Spirochaetales bacterium]